MTFWQEFKDRHKRLVLTMISKKWLVFWIGTALLIKSRPTLNVGYIDMQTWWLLAAVVIGADITQLNWPGKTTKAAE